MTSHPPIPPIIPGDNVEDVAGEDPTTKEVDGEVVLDPDANDDLVDSADADRIAAEGDS